MILQNVDPEEGNTRAINRHRYSLQEADEALQQPVVQALLQLCHSRNTHPAFNGQVCLALVMCVAFILGRRAEFLVEEVKAQPRESGWVEGGGWWRGV